MDSVLFDEVARLVLADFRCDHLIMCILLLLLLPLIVDVVSFQMEFLPLG